MEIPSRGKSIISYIEHRQKQIPEIHINRTINNYKGDLIFSFALDSFKEVRKKGGAVRLVRLFAYFKSATHTHIFFSLVTSASDSSNHV